jgi:hypothetical protein
MYLDSVIENDGEDHTLDDEQEENYDIGSDIYSKGKGMLILKCNDIT